MRFLKQLLLRNPFKGDVNVSRVWITRRSTRNKTLPFPTPRNYRQPLDILETFFAQAGRLQGDAQNNRYLEIPGFDPVMITRDPAVIRAILTATGEKPGQFDRDTLPSTGIARATGADTLLFSNGPQWRGQRKASAKAFGKTALFQEDVFSEFEKTFRETVVERIQVLTDYFAESSTSTIEIKLEPEIKTTMMEMLLCNFFGADVSRKEIRETYNPAIDRVIEHIVRDTVTQRFKVFKRFRKDKDWEAVKPDYDTFERLTDLAIAPRRNGAGAWKRVEPEFSDDDVRSNVKVFLAGALEATTSYASWALSHLARNPDYQQRVFDEVAGVDEFRTDLLTMATTLANVMRETLRLTPSLYFLPRRAKEDTWVETADGRKMLLPSGTHILLDVWHSNRIEENWGRKATGFPADEFHPDRWLNIDAPGAKSKEFLHFGFGHGARVCPGKHLGELETALVVGGVVKLFEFSAVHQENQAKAGVSTKPADGVLVNLRIR